MQPGKKFLLVALSFFFAAASFSQVGGNTASATASATIVEGVAGIEKLTDMNFTANTAQKGGIEITQEVTNGQRASFKVGGNNYAYDITVPDTAIILSNQENLETVNIGSFKVTSSQEDDSSNIIHVSATSNLQHKQAAGKYFSASALTVVVNYN